MLMVSALEFSHPMLVLVLIIADNAFRHVALLRAQLSNEQRECSISHDILFEA
jgi:hypothetical protein